MVRGYRIQVEAPILTGQTNAPGASAFHSLTCASCLRSYEPDDLRRSCDCGSTLLADYHGPGNELRSGDLWAYSWLLPIRDRKFQVTLGEGATPLIDCPPTAAALGIAELLIKNEGQQPTGTFKARGAAVSVSRALELGRQHLALATAGNSGIAWAAYAARAGLVAHVFVPTWTARETVELLRSFGADVRPVSGPVSSAARVCADEAASNDWWPVGAWAEPFRVEGDKTLGLELLADPRAASADAIVWPCASGIGLVGSWKAARDLKQVGMQVTMPALFGAQSDSCAPLVEAWRAGATDLVSGGRKWNDVDSFARGLLAPAPSAAGLILRAVRETGGGFAAVSDEQIVDAARLVARTAGLLLAPEAAAAIAAVTVLRKDGLFSDKSRIVVVATGGARPSDYFGWGSQLIWAGDAGQP